MKSNREHWNAIFSESDDSKLGWYENDASKTIELLDIIQEIKGLTVFLPGAGTSVLIEQLINRGAELVLNDISIEALNKVKERLQGKCNKIHWLCQDISLPIAEAIPNVDVWIDRAVLHFLTDENDINGYFNNVESKLKVGGYVIFAEFSKKGASKCAGLTLHRYSIEELSERLNSSFRLVSSFDYTFINPNGDSRPYVYGLYKRVK
ncbi:MAG: methyltransferase type 12 [Methylophaga sp.]|nr:MAG: methyltransferase type 12 [Methylophaga sp.]